MKWAIVDLTSRTHSYIMYDAIGCIHSATHFHFFAHFPNTFFHLKTYIKVFCGVLLCDAMFSASDSFAILRKYILDTFQRSPKKMGTFILFSRSSRIGTKRKSNSFHSGAYSCEGRPVSFFSLWGISCRVDKSSPSSPACVFSFISSKWPSSLLTKHIQDVYKSS